MSNKKLTDHQQKIEEILQAVEAAQQLQDDILKYGLDAAPLYVEDVDGDWWETWGEDEEEQPTFVESVTAFLESDDWVAVKVRKQLKDKLLHEITAELENCLSIPDTRERLFEVKKILAASNKQQGNRVTGFSRRTAGKISRNFRKP